MGDQQNEALFEQNFLVVYNKKLQEIIISLTLCSLNWSAIVKTELSELLTLHTSYENTKIENEIEMLTVLPHKVQQNVDEK